jgi:mono/diheme cytochrome c family protein
VRRVAFVLAGAALLLAGCGGEGVVSPLPSTVEGKIPTTPTAKGNAKAGLQVYNAQGCGGCHTFKAAGTTGTTGPDLDTGLKGKTPAFVQESIVNPNAVVTKGYPPNVMPTTYGSQLSQKQLADLVAFLTQK